MEKGISCNYPGNNVEDYQMPSCDEEWIPANCPLVQTNINIRKAIGAAIKIYVPPETLLFGEDAIYANAEIYYAIGLDKYRNKVDCWSPDVDHDKTFEELKKKKSDK